MSPKVSIIMPVYNGARFVAESIESVQSQTLKDWELIIVDDGSTDETPTILERANDVRITKIRQNNRGAAAARNAALDVASGEYVGFLDADDLYLPNALEDMVAFLETHREIGVVYTDGWMCNANKQPLMHLTDIRPGLYTGWILEQIVISASVVTVPVCTLCRRTDIAGGNVRFDPQLAPSEDWDFWIHLARHVQFGYLDKLTCLYRIHETNITKAVGAQRRKQDLLRGRMKVMNADWFDQLSVETQWAFFHGLLIDLLGNDPVQQMAIAHAPVFRTLPVHTQADLFRLMASHNLSQRQNPAFALECLIRSLELHPDDTRSRILFWLATRNPAWAAIALSLWGMAHRSLFRIQSIGQRRPKSVPVALLPKSE